VAAVVHRVIQEAARNALRHSGGTRMHLRLQHGAGELVVSVSDDGVGLGDFGPSFPAHAGLRIIDQRAGAVGGSVAYEPGVHGRGTAVVVSLPLADGLS
jgi:signal transduction histidine kinase